MKNHPLHITRTIKRLHAVQGHEIQPDCSRQAPQDESLHENIPEDKKAECKNQLTAQISQEGISIDQLVVRLGSWIDLVCRYRFYSKDHDSEF